MADSGKGLGQKIRSGAQWTFAGSLSTEFLNFAVGIVLARLLLPEDFGLVATVGVVTGLAGYFAGAGTGQALVRANHVERHHYNVVFTLQLLISCVIYLLFVAIASPFANFFGQPLYQPLLLVSGLNFFLRPFANVPSSFLQREMRFRPMVLINLAGLIAGSGVSIGLALIGYGVWSLVVSGLFTSLLRAILLNAHVRHSYSLTWDTAVAREMGGYGAKVAANSLLEHFRGQTLTLILSKLSGPADVGLFNRASSLSAMPMRVVGTSPYQAVFRALAAEQSNLDKSRYIYYRTLTLVAVYTVPLYILAWWLAEPGILFLYGERWLPSAEPLAILATAGCFHCIANPSGAVIEARNRVATEIRLNVVSWFLLFATAVYGLRWGLAGVAWASVITTATFSVALAVVAVRELRGSSLALMRALGPALLLNSILLSTIWLTDTTLPEGFARSSPGLYATIITSLGAFVYATSLLLLPIKSLSTESAKWRRLLLRID